MKIKTSVPFIFSAVYLLVGLLWIFFSDALTEQIFSDEWISTVQLYKGSFYVGVTAIILFWTLRSFFSRIQNQQEQYDTLMEQSVIGLAQFNTEYIVFSNSVFKRLFSFNENELRTDLSTLVHANSQLLVKETITDVITTGQNKTIYAFISNEDNLLYKFSFHVNNKEKELYHVLITRAEELDKQEAFSQFANRLFRKIEAATTAKQLFSWILDEFIGLLNAQAAYLVKPVYQAKEFDSDQDWLVLEKKETFEEYDIFSVPFSSQVTIQSRESAHFFDIPIKNKDKTIWLFRIIKTAKSGYQPNEERALLHFIYSELSIRFREKWTIIQQGIYENRLNQLLESAKISLWYLDLEAKEFTKTVNMYVLSDWFTDGDTFKTNFTWNDIRELIPIENRETITEKMENLHERSTVEFDLQVIQRNKSVVWFHTIASKYSDEISKKPIVVGLTLNVDKAKRNEKLISKSEKTYRYLFDENPAPLLLFTADSFMCVNANKAAQFLYGYTDRQLRTKSLLEFMPPEDARRFSIPHQIIRDYGFFRLGLWRHLKRNQQSIYCDLSVSAVNYNGEDSYLIMVNDVTNVIQQQQALSKSEIKYRQLFEKNPQPLLLLDSQNKVISDVNVAAEFYLNCSKKELLGKPLTFVFGDEFTVTQHELFQQLEGKSIAKKECSLSFFESQNRQVELTATQTVVDDAASLLLFIFDITELKQAEQKTIQAFIEGEDKERERVAKELHDSLGQVLSAASMNLKSAQKELQEVSFRKKEQFQKGVTFIQQAMEETRNIAQNLMPKSMNDYGLVSSVNQLILSYKDTLPFEIDFSENLGAKRLPKLMEINVYRIIQEAITNAIKYSKASVLSISMNSQLNQLLAVIKDNGVGFSDNEHQFEPGIGLKNMKSRVRLLQGVFSIESNPSAGTTITISIPLHEQIS